ncbi:hypothetical protein ABp57_gp40 [Acinetobacter phage ABp57]|nr:hypothetical protein ABp57_gp40 [Acinetobacter phage ABp57]
MIDMHFWIGITCLIICLIALLYPIDIDKDS